MKEHTMTLHSPTSNEREEFELAEITIKNAINDKEHTFTVWGDEGIQENEIEDGFPTYVWLHGVDDKISLNMDSAELQTLLEDEHLSQFSLDDLVKVDSNIEKLLHNSYENGTDFLLEIPTDKQGFDLNTILIDEEIIDMTYKAKDGELSKKDIIDFGKLVAMDSDISVGKLDYLKEPMLKVLINNELTKEEVKFAEKTFEAFQLDKTELPKSKSKIQEVKIQQHEIER